MANATAMECVDYSAANPGAEGIGPGDKDDNCWEHMEWAINDGLKTNPDWYPTGTTHAHADVQCALYLMSIGQNGPKEDGHACVHAPCAEISQSMADGAGASNAGNPMVCAPKPKPVELAPEAPEAGPSMEWWGWVLIVAAIIGLLALAGFFFMKKKAPKKKRAVQKPAPAPEPEPAPVTTTLTAMPTYVEVAPPVITSVIQEPFQSVRTLEIAQPVVAAPPVVTSVVQAPPVYVEQPMTVTAAPQTFTYMEQPQSVTMAPMTVTTAPTTYSAPVTYTTAPPMYSGSGLYAAPAMSMTQPVMELVEARVIEAPPQ